MNIKEASTVTGLPLKTIRYYETIGLVQPERQANGYRRFNQQQLHQMAFLGRARNLGFSVEDCRALLGLYNDKNRASADVKSIALRHIATIRNKIAELQDMEKTLAHLADTCDGNDRPDCPILEQFSTGASKL